MSTAAKFSNNVEISGNIDISGSINLDGTLTVDGSFSLYGYHIPDPTGEYNKVLTISGDGYSWETVQSGSAGDEVINAAGQTFYEIITEQPRAFDVSLIDGASFANTFNTIDIAWNFDDLIPKDENNQQQILNITEDLNQRVLPCITHIYFDISSSQQPNTTLTNSSKFVIAVDANDNYNIDAPTTTQQTWSIGAADLKSTLTYKTLTLSNDNTDALLYKYTVRIWGVNESNGTEVNKLTYSNLQFLTSGIPATPTIYSVTPSGTDTATLAISLNVPDIDIVNPDTEYDSAGGIEIKDVDISSTEIETLRSTISTYADYGNTFELSKTVTSQSHAGGTAEDISVNVSYQSTDFNLGSKYEIQAKCINALNATDGSNNDGYTSYSTVFQMTDFIDIPTEGTNIETEDPFDNMTYSGTTGTVVSLEINNSSSGIQIYNFSRTDNQSVKFDTPGNPSEIELSDPDADKNDSFGYGRFIDDSLNLVTLESWLNDDGTDISLHTVNFHGWNNGFKNQDVSHTYYYRDSNNASINFFTIPSSPYVDIYNNTDRKEGFRLKARVNDATILLEDMSYNNLIIPFDPYRDENGNSTGYIRSNGSNADTSYNNGYTFNYRYTHNNSHQKTISQTITSDRIYIDYFPDWELSNDSVSNWNYTLEVKTVEYIMGIPYVSTFDLSINRDHYNIHSQYRYHRDDGRVAWLNYLYASASNDSTLGSGLDNGNYQYLSLPTNIDEFNDNGTYNGGITWTSLSYATQTKAAATNNTITGFVTSTAVYNLYDSHGWFTSDITFTDNGNKNHYFDYNSISNHTTIFDNNIYEINGISVLGSNMQSVHDSLQLYQDATSSTEIKDHSILYIDGLFQLDSRTSNSNSDQYYPYPDICNSFEWNGLISSYNNNTYTNKDNRYTTSGTQDDTNGYRWLVYKVDESSSSVEFVDAGSNSAGTAGINLSYIMNKLFGSIIEEEFYDSLSDSNYDDDILVYIVGTNKSSGVHFLGRIIQDSPGFDTSNKWYSSNNITSAKSLENMASGDACGALPGSSLQASIRNNITSHSSKTNFQSNINGHSPIAIYIDSDSVGDHYFYFAIR
jgi:hypothetical protein